MSSVTKKRKADLKLVILGCASIGKTTLIHRYIEGRFQDQISTIGASFSLKQWGPYNIALWDTAGEERFSGLSSFYSRGAGAALLAFDPNSKDSFEELKTRFIPLLDSAEENCLLVVVATKLDLVTPTTRQVTYEEALLWAKDINKGHVQEIPYFETSSLTGHNVNRVFESIFQTKLPLDGSVVSNKTRDLNIIDLDGKSADENKKSGCCK